MKTIIRILFCLALFQGVQTNLFSQEKHNPNHKPYSEFKPDSIAYLKANLGGSASSFYCDRPIKEFLDDLDVPVRTIQIIFSPDERIYFLNMFTGYPSELEIEGDGIYDYPITVQLAKVVTAKDGELHEKLVDGHTDSYWRVLDPEFRKLIEPLTIYMVSYDTPR